MARRLPVRVALVLLLSATAAHAHVPFLEREDFAHSSPFTPELPHQSIAVYAWLESAEDVDYYTFELRERTPFLAEVLVPVHALYRAFRPGFALIGRGLPPPPPTLPVKPHEGYGALVFLDDAATARTSFHEPFGGKSYYRGPRLERVLEPGRYTLVYWDPQRGMGDYVAVIGKKEIWRGKDILRALRVTPRIRRGEELHLEQVRQARERKATERADEAGDATKPASEPDGG